MANFIELPLVHRKYKKILINLDRVSYVTMSNSNKNQSRMYIEDTYYEIDLPYDKIVYSIVVSAC